MLFCLEPHVMWTEMSFHRAISVSRVYTWSETSKQWCLFLPLCGRCCSQDTESFKITPNVLNITSSWECHVQQTTALSSFPWGVALACTARQPNLVHLSGRRFAFVQSVWAAGNMFSARARSVPAMQRSEEVPFSCCSDSAPLCRQRWLIIPVEE